MPRTADRASDVRLAFSNSLVADWTWTGSEYERATNGVAHQWVDREGETETITTEVLVVLQMRTYLAQPPPGGGVARAVESIGEGDAWIFADGRVIEGIVVPAERRLGIRVDRCRRRHDACSRRPSVAVVLPHRRDSGLVAVISASTIVAEIVKGDRSARDTVAGAITTARAQQDRLNVCTLIDEDRAIARAEELDQLVASGRAPGPLAGVPVALKDLIDHEGRTTTCGSGFYRHEATESAEVVQRLERAGAVIVSRTVLHEFAYGFSSENHWTGPVINPLDPSLSCGGRRVDRRPRLPPGKSPSRSAPTPEVRSVFQQPSAASSASRSPQDESRSQESFHSPPRSTPSDPSRVRSMT
jgi:hypothetical protein